ncbi:hypothetical protein L596_012707 [Steinernema carpocapsae]|uniref:Uncharacterized protein n=1 Tax=Steinernema carpocapsae TaxID=34508 RepID=A0A4U5NY21_STECR|nr:hypothetical protein L596_012707 [Steinernema carpocapsae]
MLISTTLRNRTLHPISLGKNKKIVGNTIDWVKVKRNSAIGKQQTNRRSIGAVLRETTSRHRIAFPYQNAFIHSQCSRRLIVIGLKRGF